jgi:hypothetical protein
MLNLKGNKMITSFTVFIEHCQHRNQPLGESSVQSFWKCCFAAHSIYLLRQPHRYLCRALTKIVGKTWAKFIHSIIANKQERMEPKF